MRVYPVSDTIGPLYAANTDEHVGDLSEVGLTTQYRHMAAYFGDDLSIALSSHPYHLAVARSLQGASAGTVFTASSSLLGAGIDRDELGKWIGLGIPGPTAGLTFAPPLGGIVYAKAGCLIYSVSVLSVNVC